MYIVLAKLILLDTHTPIMVGLLFLASLSLLLSLCRDCMMMATFKALQCVILQ